MLDRSVHEASKPMCTDVKGFCENEHASSFAGVCASFLIVSGSPRTQMLIRKHLYYNAITKAYRSGLEDTNEETSALLNTRLLKGF